MKEGLVQYFQGVDDPRLKRNQKHPFITIIGTTLLAGLAGIDSFSGIADFTEAHLENLKEYFDFPQGAPSHDAYRTVWDDINPQSFCDSFQLFTQSLAQMKSEIINIEGKTIRNSEEEKALHIVSAWCEANQLVLAQEKVDSKSNEITAIPNLLSLLDLKGKIITIDAMGAQRSICQQIIDQGGDYQISLKGNQGTLFDDIQRYFADPAVQADLLYSEENDKGHGRIEQRTAFVTDQMDWLQEYHQWPGLKSIGMVVSKVQKGEKQTTEERFYITSLSANARKMNEVAQAHWGIESAPQVQKKEVYYELRSCG